MIVQRQIHGTPLLALARRLGVEDRLKVLPCVDGGELVTLYQTAAALLQPSSYEGFGLPVAEAMACGCPVLASDLATLREVIGRGGMLLPVNDVAAFSRAIARLAESADLREDLGAAAAERSKTFSWDRCARETLEVLRDAAAAGASRDAR